MRKLAAPPCVCCVSRVKFAGSLYFAAPHIDQPEGGAVGLAASKSARKTTVSAPSAKLSRWIRATKNVAVIVRACIADSPRQGYRPLKGVAILASPSRPRNAGVGVEWRLTGSWGSAALWWTGDSASSRRQCERQPRFQDLLFPGRRGRLPPGPTRAAQMLEKKGRIRHQPGQSRTIEVLVPNDEISAWVHRPTNRSGRRAHGRGDSGFGGRTTMPVGVGANERQTPALRRREVGHGIVLVEVRNAVCRL